MKDCKMEFVVLVVWGVVFLLALVFPSCWRAMSCGEVLAGAGAIVLLAAALVVLVWRFSFLQCWGCLIRGGECSGRVMSENEIWLWFLGSGVVGMVFVGLAFSDKTPRDFFLSADVVYLIVAAIVALFGLVSLGISSVNSWRLKHELDLARKRRRFRDKETLKKCAAKEFLPICRRRDEILAAHERRYAEDPTWIDYLRKHLEEGGDEILSFYDEEVELLQEAEKVNAETSYEKYRKMRAREDVSETGERVLGETDIALEQQRRQEEAGRSGGIVDKSESEKGDSGGRRRGGLWPGGFG